MIKVNQISSEETESKDISDHLNLIENNFNRKFEYLHNFLIKKVLLGQDDNSKAFYKILKESKNSLTKIHSYVE